MKIFSFLLLAICLCNIHCEKNSSLGPVLTGKLIVNGPCSHYVIQLEKGTIDSEHITATWLDHDNDSIYNNVFTVANYCTFGNYGLQKGDVITFQVDPNPPAQTCAICLIAVDVPPKLNAVVNVKRVK